MPPGPLRQVGIASDAPGPQTDPNGGPIPYSYLDEIEGMISNTETRKRSPLNPIMGVAGKGGKRVYCLGQGCSGTRDRPFAQVAGASHEPILPETPWENVVAMFDAVQEHGACPS